MAIATGQDMLAQSAMRAAHVAALLLTAASGYALGRRESRPTVPLPAPAVVTPPTCPLEEDLEAPKVMVEPAPPAQDAVDPRFDPRRAPTCAGVTVEGILALERPAWSRAIVSTRAEGERIVRVGDRFGDERVLFIGPLHVWLASPSSSTTYAVCQAELGPAPAAPAAIPVVATPTVVPRGVDPFAALASKIEQRGPHDFVVDRGAFEALLENQTALAANVRVEAETGAGTMRGVKLAFVRPGSVVEKLGLEAGDALRSINGFDFTSPEHILEAYARLRTASRLSLEVVRGGKATEIDYEIR